MIILIIAALVPPLALTYYIYRQDKIDKEPVDLIIKLLLCGALTVVPAIIIEPLLTGVENTFLPRHTLLYQIIENYIVVAWTEEGVKHYALKKLTWKHPAFDYTFDAVVYSVCVSLGFAAAENIFYVFDYGLSTALVRAVTAIPGHCIFGIYMGYYYGRARRSFVRMQPGRSRLYMFLSMLIPILLHGTYDIAAGGSSTTASIFFLAFIIVLDIVAVVSVHNYSRHDERLF